VALTTTRFKIIQQCLYDAAIHLKYLAFSIQERDGVHDEGAGRVLEVWKLVEMKFARKQPFAEYRTNGQVWYIFERQG